VPRTLGGLALLCALAISAPGADCAGQGAGKKPNSKSSALTEGAALYKRNCAVCHGNDGKGGGPPPRSSPFTAPTPDLTTLAQRHGGKFPDGYVAGVLRSGVKMPDHGPAEMPVWGTIFKSVAQSDEAQIHKRIESLIAYLKSFQVKP
jgi:mono/diheme cytochrome c family protein